MVAPMHTADLIRDKLTRAFSPLELDIEDDSARHRGHAGAAGGGGHFNVRIVAAVFEGKSLVARHRLVYAELAEEMKSAVHALALHTMTPAEAEAEAAAAADEAESRIITNA
jgi:BolA family transcriptional regulator, general stress-responsive regulator